MKGNRRPQATMSPAHSELLPSARIRCGAGRIQVGSRTYQSASDALSAYMQQFEPKQKGGAGSGRSARGAALDEVVHKTARNGGTSALHRKYDPANVTGLLTSSVPSEAMNGMMLDSSLRSAGSPQRGCLNGAGSPQKSPKLSVSFALPDSVNDTVGHSKLAGSKLSGTVSVSGLSSPRQHSSTLYDSKLESSVNLHSVTQNSCSDMLGLTQPGTTSVASMNSCSRNISGDASSPSLSKSNGFVDIGSAAPLSQLIHNRQLPKPSSQAHAKTSPSPQVTSQRAKSEVEVLLTEAPTQSELNSLSQPSSGEGKLRALLQDTSVPESSSTSSDKSALQQEVEQALSRSAQLLETIKTDVLVSPRCVSDVDSLSTDVLLSINPQKPTETIPPAAGGGRQGRSRHRYSYHTATHQPRSLSVGPVMGGSQQCSVQTSGRQRSVDSLQSAGLARLNFLDLNDSVSNLSESGGLLKRLQAAELRSLSGLSADSTEADPRATGQTGPPSWIQELIPPTPTNHVNGKDMMDSLFSVRDMSGGRKAPSWVNGLEQSDIASSVATQDLQEAAESLALGGGGQKLHGADTVKKAFEAAIRADDSVTSELSYAGPGLNYSDLVSSPAANGKKGTPASQLPHKRPGKVSRTNSFGGTGSNVGVTMRRDVDRSKPPVTMNRIFQDLAGVDARRSTTPQAAAPNLSASLGADSSSTASLLRRKVCDDSSEAAQSMDQYLSQVTGGSEGSVGETGRRVGEIPRCSSINMLNGTGDLPDVPSNITGASSITKDSNFSSKLCLDDPTLTPARQSQAVSALKKNGGGGGVRGDDADLDLLEGDRPWESQVPSFKSPVYVGSSSPENANGSMSRPETPTLSGGQQPGSMEALKQMLFRLQTEESSSSAPPQHPAPPPPPASALVAVSQDNKEAELMPALKDYDFEVEPGGQSLERALVHLGRLKTLVQNGTAPAPPSGPGSQEQPTCS
ncbi:uncharacterized protein LOC143297276 [Babylonia areolata]|uniref:uncharacterized protein LOC143297276 n=1 Tax=Babylonia areolata TaxID=304850 RepID=UPI003FCEE8FA